MWAVSPASLFMAYTESYNSCLNRALLDRESLDRLLWTSTTLQGQLTQACVMFRNRFKETIVLQEKWRVYFKSLIFYFCFLDVASLLKTCQHFSDGNFRSTRILLHDFFSTWSMFSLWKGSVTDGFIHNYLKLSNDKWDCLVSMLTFC